MSAPSLDTPRNIMRAGLVRFLAVLPCFLGVLLLCPRVARAQSEGPTSPAKYVAPQGYRTKEFTLVRKDGWFHIFYLRENLIPGAPTQRSFGHAISRDLYLWAEQDTVLPVVDGSFEETMVWAPSLHKVGDTYYLFYPGVRDDPANGYHIVQSMTYATSTDLYAWTRRETPLFSTELFPWAFVDSSNNEGHDCRDPFLWRDEASGEWLLYVATRPAFRPQSMVIGIAGSTDLETWSDRGYVPITLPTSSFSDVAESPHLFTRDGTTLYILWTTNAGQQLTYGTSTDPLVGWGNSRRLRSMLGYSTLGWWGSEILEADGRTYFGNVHTTWIDFWDMKWTAPDSFALSVPDPLQLLGAVFDRDSATAGDTIAIVVASVNGAGREVALEYSAPDSGGMAIDPQPLGLPPTVTLSAAESTTVTVVLPDSLVPIRVEVRVPGSPAAPPSVLALSSPEGPPPDPDPPPDPGPYPGDDLPGEPIPPVTRAIVQFGGSVRFVRASAPSGFSVAVFDARGRRVWSERAGAGVQELVWRPETGARAGIYFARVSAPGETRAQTLKVPLVVAH
jgi:hypothetical protein